MTSMSFRDELEYIINKYSMENGSGTPDFILANFMAQCLIAFDTATLARDKWYGQRLSSQKPNLWGERNDDINSR
jgi:hypothetical protein